MDLDQVCPIIEKNDSNEFLNVPVNNGVRRIPLSDILFIETKGHTLVYHLKNELLLTRGNSLKSLEKRLTDYGFACCHTSYLVNLEYCHSVLGDTITVGEEKLNITRTKKKEFIKRLASFFSTNGIQDS